MTALVLEAPWFGVDSLQIPTSTGRLVDIDRIDMRFEDMRNYGGVKIADVYNWIAPLPNGGFITHDHGIVDEQQAQELMAKWGGPDGKGRAWALPDDWWHYALGTKDGRIVKAPKHPRKETGEPTQEEADQQAQQPSGPPVESYDRRLHNLLCKPF